MFDQTENIYSDITNNFTIQSDVGNNYIMLALHYDADNILTTSLKNRTGYFILNGISKFVTN